MTTRSVVGLEVFLSHYTCPSLKRTRLFIVFRNSESSCSSKVVSSSKNNEFNQFMFLPFKDQQNSLLVVEVWKKGILFEKNLKLFYKTIQIGEIKHRERKEYKENLTEDFAVFFRVRSFNYNNSISDNSGVICSIDSLETPESSFEIINCRYKVLSPIGAGGFASVFKVVDLKYNRVVALKQVKCRSKEEMNESFNEILNIKQLSHERLVKYHDLFIHDDEINTVCFTMELFECDLVEYLKKRKLFNEKEVIHYFGQLTDGLHHLHSAGFIHHDLKARNIFVDTLGEFSIGDFGLLKKKKHQDKTLRGTLNYFAPEIFQEDYDKEEIDQEKVDSFALGIVFYMIITKKVEKRAFYMDIFKDYDVFKKNIKSDIIKAGIENERIIKIILGLMEKDPEKRYSVGQIKQFITKIQNDWKKMKNYLKILPFYVRLSIIDWIGLSFSYSIGFNWGKQKILIKNPNRRIRMEKTLNYSMLIKQIYGYFKESRIRKMYLIVKSFEVTIKKLSAEKKVRFVLPILNVDMCYVKGCLNSLKDLEKNEKKYKARTLKFFDVYKVTSGFMSSFLSQFSVVKRFVHYSFEDVISEGGLKNLPKTLEYLWVRRINSANENNFVEFLKNSNPKKHLSILYGRKFNTLPKTLNVKHLESIFIECNGLNDLFCMEIIRNCENLKSFGICSHSKRTEIKVTTNLLVEILKTSKIQKLKWNLDNLIVEEEHEFQNKNLKVIDVMNVYSEQVNKNFFSLLRNCQVLNTFHFGFLKTDKIKFLNELPGITNIRICVVDEEGCLEIQKNQFVQNLEINTFEFNEINLKKNLRTLTLIAQDFDDSEKDLNIYGRIHTIYIDFKRNKRINEANIYLKNRIRYLSKIPGINQIYQRVYDDQKDGYWKLIWGRDLFIEKYCVQ